MRSMPVRGPSDLPDWHPSENGGDASTPLPVAGRTGVRAKVALVEMAEELPENHRALLERRFNIVPCGAFPASRQGLDRLVGLPVLLATSRFAVTEALGLVRALRRAGSGHPILLFGEQPSRSSDRVHALRSGADDFLCGGVSPEELLLKLELHMSRDPDATPRRNDREMAAPSVGVRQAVDETGAPAPLSESRFTDAIGRHVDAEEGPRFSVILFRTRTLPRPVQKHFTRLSLRQVRRSEGDLVGKCDEGLGIYLHGAGRREARQFLGRLLVRWAGSGGEDVGFVLFSYPTQSRAVRDFLTRPKGREPSSARASDSNLETDDDSIIRL